MPTKKPKKRGEEGEVEHKDPSQSFCEMTNCENAPSTPQEDFFVIRLAGGAQKWADYWTTCQVGKEKWGAEDKQEGKLGSRDT